jgi:hypothetical protein
VRNVSLSDFSETLGFALVFPFIEKDDRVARGTEGVGDVVTNLRFDDIARLAFELGDPRAKRAERC